MLTLVIIVGCGNNDSSEKEQTGSIPTPKVETTKSPEVVPTPEPSVQPTQEPVEAAKVLSADEQLSLDYANIYLNGTDLDAKKKFVAEKVREDVRSIFELGTSSVADENNMLKGAEVVGSSDYETSGMKGSITLLRGDNEKELIVLILEGKLGFVFNSESAEEALKKNFDEMKAMIK